MASIISDIEFIVGRGNQYDPAAGTFQYRNPALKNRIYRPYGSTIGYLASSKFTVVNDTVNDIYGFDLTGGALFQNGDAWFVSLFAAEPFSITMDATIITTDYFIRNIFIPQAVNDAATRNRVEQFIRQHEPEVLVQLLGYPFYREFFENIMGPSPVQKYEDLLFGAEYTDANGNLQKWMGFYNPQKLSIIANYVYWNYMRNIHTTTTAGGESVQKSEGGYRTDARQKTCRAWNEMIRWVAGLKDYLNCRQTDYPLWQQYSFPDYLFETVNTFGI